MNLQIYSINFEQAIQGSIKFYWLIVFTLLCYTRKGQNFWPLKVTKAASPKKAKIFQKNKYGSKCLEFPNLARKAKKLLPVIKFQRPLGSWSKVKRPFLIARIVSYGPKYQYLILITFMLFLTKVKLFSVHTSPLLKRKMLHIFHDE